MEKDCYLTITHELEAIAKLSHKSHVEGLHVGPDNVAIATDGRICAFLGGYDFDIDFCATIPLAECVHNRIVNLRCFERTFKYRASAFELLRRPLTAPLVSAAAFSPKRVQSMLRVINKICAKDSIVSWHISDEVLRLDTMTTLREPLTFLLARITGYGSLPFIVWPHTPPPQVGGKRSITKVEV